MSSSFALITGSVAPDICFTCDTKAATAGSFARRDSARTITALGWPSCTSVNGGAGSATTTTLMKMAGAAESARRVSKIIQVNFVKERFIVFGWFISPVWAGAVSAMQG